MDDNTKDAAFEKLENMKALIAYPDEFMEDKKLDDYYSNLSIDLDSSYLKNHLSINLFQRACNFEKLRHPFNRTDWVNFKILNSPRYKFHQNILGKLRFQSKIKTFLF